jgi:ELWxxDGT repeat protein
MKKNSLFTICFSMLYCINLNAQTLVKDINTADASSDPKEFLVIGNKTYFSADDGKTGRELWVTDGTDAGTKLVKDITPGENSTNISSLTNLNGTLLFWAAVNNDYSLYKSDGTATGTVKITDVNIFFSVGGFTYSNTYSGYPEPSITVSNNIAYYNANGFLWKTDGTSTGTTKLLDGKSFVNNKVFKGTNFNNKLYFVASSTGGDGLWESDGTINGTKLVKKMNLEVPECYKPPVIFKNKLYFIATTVETGAEVWGSDGTEGGTKLVKDVWNSGDPTDKNGAYGLYSSTNAMFFVGRSDLNGCKLWKSDGTSEGTFSISTKLSGLSPEYYNYNLNPDLVFRGFEFKNKFYLFIQGLNAINLFESDATETGTKLVNEIGAFRTSLMRENIKYAFVVNDSLIFFRDEGGDIAVLNGMSTGKRIVKSIGKNWGIPYASNFTKVGNVVYFGANSKNMGRELWKTDGTEAGTVLIKNINVKSEGSKAYALTKFGNNIIFKAYNDDDGREVWKTDGTTNGTQRISNTYSGLNSGLDLQYYTPFTEINNKLLFLAQDSTYGEELRYFDSTLSKINLLKDIEPGIYTPNYIGSLTPYKNKAIFLANNRIYGNEPWITDCTEGGTQVLSDLTPGASGTRFYSNFSEYNNEMYFLTNSVNGNGVRFWKTDGTAVGTKVVLSAEIDSSNNRSFTKNLVNINSRFLFPNSLGNEEPWLWVIEGLTTKKLIKLSPSNYAYGYIEGLYYFKVFNNSLYFTQTDEYSTLWKTDGTEGGTKKISTEKFKTLPFITTYKNTLYCFANDTTFKFNLWKINENGTFGFIKSLGYFGPYNPEVIEWDNKLYFLGYDSTNGYELWSSDGTDQGTKLVFDINKGASSSIPHNFTVLNNTLYFSADDGVTGDELWKISSLTGIAELVISDIKITIFPNPTKDILNITNEEKEPLTEVRLYNLQGQMLKSNAFKDFSTQINVRDLPPATYLLEFWGENKRTVKKFVKTN